MKFQLNLFLETLQFPGPPEAIKTLVVNGPSRRLGNFEKLEMNAFNFCVDVALFFNLMLKATNSPATYRQIFLKRFISSIKSNNIVMRTK